MPELDYFLTENEDSYLVTIAEPDTTTEWISMDSSDTLEIIE